MQNQEDLRKNLATVVGRALEKFYSIVKILLSVCASVSLCTEHIFCCSATFVLVKSGFLLTKKIS